MLLSEGQKNILIVLLAFATIGVVMCCVAYLVWTKCCVGHIQKAKRRARENSFGSDGYAATAQDTTSHVDRDSQRHVMRDVMPSAPEQEHFSVDLDSADGLFATTGRNFPTYGGHDALAEISSTQSTDDLPSYDQLMRQLR